MRPLPAGIRLERATVATFPRALAVVREGVESYKEWAPEWEPVHPPEERLRELEQMIDDDEAWVLMAVDESGATVGVVSLATRTAADSRPLPPGAVYLWQMFARPAWQGTGLAQALQDRADEEARRRGYDRLVLWAAEGAAQARRFYEREGWMLTGERDDDARFGLPLVQYARGV